MRWAASAIVRHRIHYKVPECHDGFPMQEEHASYAD